MKELFRVAIAVAAATCMATSAQASVLTFEDLPPGRAFFLADYHGFRFGTNNLATTAWFHTDEVSAFYTPSSPTTYIATDFQLYDNTNPSEPAQSITSTIDFIFNGAFFSGGDQIHYDLYLNGALVHTSPDSALLTNVPMFVASGYNGLVDEVVVWGPQGFYALDDFTYNVIAAAVPEPASLGLALFALLSAGAIRHRRTSP